MPLDDNGKKLFQERALAFRHSDRWRDVVLGTAMRIVERNGEAVHPGAAVLLAIELVDKIRELPAAEAGHAQRIFERNAPSMTADRAIDLAKETVAIFHQAFTDPLDLRLNQDPS